MDGKRETIEPNFKTLTESKSQYNCAGFVHLASMIKVFGIYVFMNIYQKVADLPMELF